MNDHEKAREGLAELFRGVQGTWCQLDCDYDGSCAECLAEKAIAFPMIGVIAKDQCADTIGELEWFKKGWRKLANMGTRPNQPADGL